MSSGPVLSPARAGRPVISEPQDGPGGRSFAISFAPGDELPPHRNKARVVITVASGDGTIVVAGHGTRTLSAGTLVQLEPDAEHGIVAGSGGLELVVALVQNCCESCS